MLNNKKIVIIGGTTGLGFAAAKAFIKNGAKTIIVGRNPESCITAELSLGENAKVQIGDATHPETAKKDIEMC
jgi:NAD(P)-dependent dehydrogenase (short-subunit alcohol dehydrogenase family)